jgi:hypothetical protein
MNRPVQTFRDGPVLCSVWLRQSTVGVFYDVTVCRTYREESTGKERYAYAFSDRQLTALSRLVSKAAAWIAEKKRNATTVVIDAS